MGILYNRISQHGPGLRVTYRFVLAVTYLLTPTSSDTHEEVHKVALLLSFSGVRPRSSPYVNVSVPSKYGFKVTTKRHAAGLRDHLPTCSNSGIRKVWRDSGQSLLSQRDPTAIPVLIQSSSR